MAILVYRRVGEIENCIYRVLFKDTAPKINGWDLKILKMLPWIGKHIDTKHQILDSMLILRGVGEMAQ